MIQFGVAVLFNSLWVALLVALAVQTVFWLAPRSNATTRYAAWTLALAASVLLSVAITLPHTSTVAPSAQATLGTSAVKTQPASKPATPTNHPRYRTEIAARQSVTPPPRLRLAVPAALATLPFFLWAVIVAAILVRLATALWQLEKLKRDALPVPIELRDDLSAWAQAHKGDRGVRLCTSDRITVPVAVGLFDSLILLPSRLLRTLSHHEIDQILLHELAHLRRADDWTNCLQRVVEALFFFNPAMLWMARKLDIEREVACDDWVVAQTRDVRPYALCLTRMAEVTAWPHRALAAPGVFFTRKGLSIRVERLLAAGRNIGTSVAVGTAGLVAGAILALLFVAQTVAPSIAFTLPIVSTPVPPAPPRVPATAVRAMRSPAPAVAPATPSFHIAVPVHRAHLFQHRQVVMQHAHASTRATVPVLPHLPTQPTAVSNATIATSFNCMGCDFTAARWAGRDLHGSNLTGANFSNADLTHVNFSGANLSGADFQGADLSSASFRNANLSGANLSRANIAGVDLSNANLDGCRIDVARLSPSQTHAVLEHCRGCDLQGADLRGQDLRGLTLSGVNLERANLSGADLSGAHFNGVVLDHATIAGARLTGTSFTGCDFSGVDLRSVDLSRAHITGSDLSNAIMR